MEKEPIEIFEELILKAGMVAQWTGNNGGKRPKEPLVGSGTGHPITPQVLREAQAGNNWTLRYVSDEEEKKLSEALQGGQQVEDADEHLQTDEQRLADTPVYLFQQGTAYAYTQDKAIADKHGGAISAMRLGELHTGRAMQFQGNKVAHHMFDPRHLQEVDSNGFQKGQKESLHNQLGTQYSLRRTAQSTGVSLQENPDGSFKLVKGGEGRGGGLLAFAAATNNTALMSSLQNFYQTKDSELKLDHAMNALLPDTGGMASFVHNYFEGSEKEILNNVLSMQHADEVQNYLGELYAEAISAEAAGQKKKVAIPVHTGTAVDDRPLLQVSGASVVQRKVEEAKQQAAQPKPTANQPVAPVISPTGVITDGFSPFNNALKPTKDTSTKSEYINAMVESNNLDTKPAMTTSEGKPHPFIIGAVRGVMPTLSAADSEKIAQMIVDHSPNMEPLNKHKIPADITRALGSEERVDSLIREINSRQTAMKRYHAERMSVKPGDAKSVKLEEYVEHLGLAMGLGWRNALNRGLADLEKNSTPSEGKVGETKINNLYKAVDTISQDHGTQALNALIQPVTGHMLHGSCLHLGNGQYADVGMLMGMARFLPIRSDAENFYIGAGDDKVTVPKDPAKSGTLTDAQRLQAIGQLDKLLRDDLVSGGSTYVHNIQNYLDWVNNGVARGDKRALAMKLNVAHADPDKFKEDDNDTDYSAERHKLIMAPVADGMSSLTNSFYKELFRGKKQSKMIKSGKIVGDTVAERIQTGQELLKRLDDLDQPYPGSTNGETTRQKMLRTALSKIQNVPTDFEDMKPHIEKLFNDAIESMRSDIQKSTDALIKDGSDTKGTGVKQIGSYFEPLGLVASAYNAYNKARSEGHNVELRSNGFDWGHTDQIAAHMRSAQGANQEHIDDSPSLASIVDGSNSKASQAGFTLVRRDSQGRIKGIDVVASSGYGEDKGGNDRGSADGFHYRFRLEKNEQGRIESRLKPATLEVKFSDDKHQHPAMMFSSNAIQRLVRHGNLFDSVHMGKAVGVDFEYTKKGTAVHGNLRFGVPKLTRKRSNGIKGITFQNEDHLGSKNAHGLGSGKDILKSHISGFTGTFGAFSRGEE